MKAKLGLAVLLITLSLCTAAFARWVVNYEYDFDWSNHDGLVTARFSFYSDSGFTSVIHGQFIFTDASGNVVLSTHENIGSLFGQAKVIDVQVRSVPSSAVKLTVQLSPPPRYWRDE